MATFPAVYFPVGFEPKMRNCLPLATKISPRATTGTIGVVKGIGPRPVGGEFMSFSSDCKAKADGAVGLHLGLRVSLSALPCSAITSARIVS